MAWYKRERDDESAGAEKRSVPAGTFTKCPGCSAPLLTAEMERNAFVCPPCGHHFPMPTDKRIELVMDEGTFSEADTDVTSIDPLGFADTKRYADRLRTARRSAGPSDAFRAGSGTIDGAPVEAGFFVFEFMGGSMGSVVGEKITRLYERALARKVPALVFSASGGARMQEGVLSLMQMAKTSAALGRLREAGLPYFSILLHPTTGGVAASFAMLGDVIIAEPKALIGFARARVIQNTIRQRLPPGFQRAEFLLEHGFLNRIVPRPELKPTLSRLVRLPRPAAPAGVTRYVDLLARLDVARRGGVLLGLDRMHAVLAALGNPERRAVTVQIAGTNGKGSTAAMTDAILREAGIRTGLYTSPHLCRFTERIEIDGREVDGDALAALDADVAATGVPLTYFEIATALAFRAFAAAAVDVVVLETGLGGRLDATTAAAPVATAITSIALDHTEILGPTLADIAREKAGIAKPGVPLYLAPVPPEAEAVILGVARAAGAPVVRVTAGEGVAGVARALTGAHQASNAAVAVALARAAAAALQPPRAVPDDAVARGLAGVRWPGRLERIAPDLLVDCAHNADGAAALARALDELPRGPRALVISIVGGKDLGAIVEQLVARVDAVVATRSANERALPPDVIAREVERQVRTGAPSVPVTVAPDPAAAVVAARAALRNAPARGGADDRLVVVAGSVFLAGEVRVALLGEAVDPISTSDPIPPMEVIG